MFSAFVIPVSSSLGAVIALLSVFASSLWCQLSQAFLCDVKNNDIVSIFQSYIFQQHFTSPRGCNSTIYCLDPPGSLRRTHGVGETDRHFNRIQIVDEVNVWVTKRKRSGVGDRGIGTEVNRHRHCSM